MNSNLLFPLIPLKMKSCQGWDIYLYLASNWSGFWRCIFSSLFKPQKLLKSQAVILGRGRVSDPHHCSSLYASNSVRFVTKMSHCIYVYIHACYCSFSPASPPLSSSLTCFSHAFLSFLHNCHCTVPWGGFPSLWLQKHIGHSGSNRADLTDKFFFLVVFKQKHVFPLVFFPCC